MYWWERFGECGKKTYLDQNPPAPPKRTMIPGNILKSMKQCKKNTILILSFLFLGGYLYPYAVWLYSVILTVSFISPQWSQFLLPATALHLFHLDLLAIPSELQMLSIDHMSNCVNYESTSEIPNGVICSPVLWDHI